MSDLYVVANPVAANPLALPVDSAPDLNIASYKTYHRLRIGVAGFPEPELSHGWMLWIGVADQIWPVRAFDTSVWAKGGLVYSKGEGTAADQGTAASLAKVSGHPQWKEIETALRDADRFFLFATNPTGTMRTRVWMSENDHWDYSKRQANGAPKKLRRARVGKFGVLDDPLAPEWVLFPQAPPPPEPEEEEEENMSVSVDALTHKVVTLTGDATDNLSDAVKLSDNASVVTMVEVLVYGESEAKGNGSKQVILNAAGVEIAEFWTEPGRNFYAVPVYPGVAMAAGELVRATVRFGGEVSFRAKFRGYRIPDNG